MPLKVFPEFKSSTQWGNISGNIGDQLDLASQFDGKSQINHNHDQDYEPKDPALQSHLADASNPHATTKQQIGLSNVTNDAQLRRSANDFGNFPEKTQPTTDDRLIIEDSDNFLGKAYIKLANLPQDNGSPDSETISISSAYQITEVNKEIMLIAPTINALAIYLPQASLSTGKMYVIQNISSGSHYIAINAGAFTIQKLYPAEALSVISDGANWILLSTSLWGNRFDRKNYTNLGIFSKSSSNSVALGYSANAGINGTAIGSLANASQNAIALGSNANASFVGAIAIGNGTVARRNSELSFQSDAIASNNKNRMMITGFTEKTTSAVNTKELRLSGGNCSVIGNSSIAFRLIVNAISASGLAKAWEATAIIRKNGSGLALLPSQPIINIIGYDAGTDAWTIALTSEVAGGERLAITATGATNEDTNWHAVLIGSEIIL